MYSWLIENIKFPDTEAAKKIDKKQRVVVRFAISETGKVHSPEIVKSASLPEFDKEALRIVNELPDFVPGTQNGKPVATTYTLPIVFAAK